MRTNYNLRINREIKRPLYSSVSELAHKMEVKAYLVGGFVRDLILDRPSKDIDILVTGSGVSFAEALATELHGTAKINVFKNFGTAQILWEGEEIEIVGARKESYRKSSRKPEVEEGTLEDDLKRRDFTINALAVSLNRDTFGELEDHFNGLEDIDSRTLRTPLEPLQTFSDDPLRMMRALRFAAQLNFKIEAKTFNAIAENRERLAIVSQERITDEVNKVMAAPVPSVGFKIMKSTGLMPLILKELDDLHGVETIENKSHKDNFYHTLQVLDNVAAVSNNLWLRWAALMHDIGKPATKVFDPDLGWTFHGHEVVGERMVPGIFRRMKLPMNEKMRYVQKLVALHLRPIALTQQNVSESGVRRLIIETGEDIDDLFALCRADITSKNMEKVDRYLKRFDKLYIRLKEVEEKDRLRNWSSPITGSVIMTAFGLKPSATVGKLKGIVKEAILNGDIPNEFDAAYKFMLQEGKKMGLVPQNIENP